MTPVPPDAADCAVNRVRFLTAGEPERNRVRPAILASWERSRDHGIAADRVCVPFVRDPEADTPLTRSADPVLTRLAERLSGQAVSIILTDAAGLVLSRRTPDSGFERQLDRVLLAPGFTYAERFAGTNGIGTALETRRPTQVLGHEHYAENLERLACAAAPIHHPLTGRLAGILDLTCLRKDTDALLLTLVESTAEQIQQAMLAASCPDELAVLAAYRQTCHRSADAVVAVASDAVLLNDRARRELDAADQAAIVTRVSAVGTTLRPGRRLTVDAMLSGSRPARLHCLSVGTGGRSDGVVVRIRIGAPPATDPAGHRTATPPAAPRAALPGVVGSSVLWNQLVGRAQTLLAEGTWLALRGEPGSGRATLARALAHRRPGGGTIVLDARHRDTWPVPPATAVGTAGAVLVLHADELDPPDVSLVAGLLDACDRTALWVAMTIGTAARRPDTDALLDRVRHVLDVPALRLRPDDVPELALHLLDGDAETLTFSPDALRVLVRSDWPGNVAQLRSAMRHVRAVRRSGSVERSDLPSDLHTTSRHALTPLESMERDAIATALADAAGNKEVAARSLGISRATIYRRIHEYGILAPPLR